VAYSFATSIAVLGGAKVSLEAKKPVSIRIGAKGFAENEYFALACLLYPYRVQLSMQVDDSDLSISKGCLPGSSKSVVKFQTSHKSTNNDDGDTVEFPFELLRFCSERLQVAMEPRIGLTYNLATRLPFQYNIVPPILRNRIVRGRSVDSNLSSHLACERTRRALKQSCGALGFRLERKRDPLLLVTHDVETEKGLQKALLLKDLEDDVGVESTWFIVSDEYHIPTTIAKELSHSSRIGSHDFKHDGRLVHIRKQKELVNRLKRSRLKLQRIFEADVKCFRSPLLQFSGRIVQALAVAGYDSDFSLPCWEPFHPACMTGFGVEYVHAFEIGGMLEFPLSLFQDHQVLNALRMSTSEAVKLWTNQAKLVRSMGGDIVLLVHPDYAFSQDLEKYRELLVSLLEIQSSEFSE
jgi:hypothetical protein